MKKVALLTSLILTIISIPIVAYADDTDIYSSSYNVKPNVLIIFDNSGSMLNGVPYDDNTLYSGAYNNGPTDVYRRRCLRWSGSRCRRWSAWEVYTGTFTDTDYDGIDDTDTNIRKGNRLNYDYGSQQQRLTVAKTAVKDIIDKSIDQVRFGIMVLNGSIKGLPDNTDNPPADVAAYHNDTTVLSSTYGGAEIGDWTATTLKNRIDAITAQGSNDTPLANRLINAIQYFKGDFGSYASPITSTYWCRKNYVIIVTDGIPEVEGYMDTLGAWHFPHIVNFMNSVTDPDRPDYDNDGRDPDPTDFDYINCGSDYLDDVAMYANEADLSTVEGEQNLTVYTIGFTVDHRLLRESAENGGGDYYTTGNIHDLTTALVAVIESIIETAQTFTAPVVPVQRTTSGDKLYVSLFTPQASDNFWPGYLIKLKLDPNAEMLGFSSGYGVGDPTTPVTDSNGALHKDLLNPSKPPYPYWDAQQKLKESNLANRNIYTFLVTSTLLTDASNRFDTDKITAPMLGNPTHQATADPLYSDKDNLIRYIYGWDAYDKDTDDVYAEKREYILGDILHSQPLIIDYKKSDQSNPSRVIYVGTNDGMLHAFNDTDGSEKWAFIPPDLLPKLKNIVEGSTHSYFVDSSPKAYILDYNKDGDLLDSNDKAIIIFGERSGGNSYYALDVTNPDEPKFMWKIDNTMGDFTAMGQTWSEPQIGKVKKGASDKVVAIIGGGNYESDTAKGNAIYLVDVTNGTKVKSFTHTDMTASIPSTVLAVDTTFDGYIDRVYVGDLKGQMWRIGSTVDIESWTTRLLFNANGSTSEKRKIFYPPDLVLDRDYVSKKIYSYLYFGTGDREDPMKLTTGAEGSGFYDRFYAVKDWNESDPYTTLLPSDLINVTDDLLQGDVLTQDEKATLREDILRGKGWYISMENDGEKVLAPPTVIFGTLFFTTFAPVNTTLYPCSYGGDGRAYAVDYLTGEAVLDMDDSGGDLTKEDRELKIGHGIPTEVVIVITPHGDIWPLIGIGGGVVGGGGGGGGNGGPPPPRHPKWNYDIRSWFTR